MVKQMKMSEIDSVLEINIKKTRYNRDSVHNFKKHQARNKNNNPKGRYKQQKLQDCVRKLTQTELVKQVLPKGLDLNDTRFIRMLLTLIKSI